MAGIIRYLLLANFFLVAMALFYHLVLSRETFFKVNRFILILGVILSLVIPFVQFGWLPAGSFSIITIPEIIVSAKSGIMHIDLDEIQIFGTAPFYFPWLRLFSTIYIAGAIAMGISLIMKIKKLQNWTKEYPMKWFRNLYITILPGHWSPFSFLGIVYFPAPFNRMDKGAQMILEHEKVHVHQKHGWDIIFIEIIKIIFFYNPAIYTIKKQIQINHEYLADSTIVGEDRKSYSQELIRNQLQVPQFQFIQQFNQSSLLKRRILMLMKNKSNYFGAIKYLMILPLIGGLLWFSACTDEADQQIINKEIEKAPIVTNNVISSDIIEIYAEAILAADYSELNKKEKGVKAVAVEMEKTGAGKEEIVNYVKKRISSWASHNIDEISSSELFKSKGLNIDNLEIKTLEVELPQKRAINDPEEESEVFYIVEDMPLFEGEGLEQFRNWVQENIKYPEIASSNGIAGTVYVSFIVTKAGDISQVKIVRGVDPSLDDEVKRTLNSAPAWTPGKQRGKEVNVQMAIPVKFQLQ